MLVDPSKKLVLQTPGFGILLDLTDRPCQPASACIQPEIALLRVRRDAITAIMAGMVRVPPDTHVDVQVAQCLKASERQALSICGHSIPPHELGMGCQDGAR